MQYKWLNKQNNKNLIVFFNGWGMDEKIVNNLAFEDYDVLVLFDYRTFEIPAFDFSLYEKKYMVCWSMGVYVCNYFYDIFKDFDGYTAVNGTQKPVDDNYGIPEVIYNLTVDNFNELTCAKFMKKISSTVDLKDYCTRGIEELKQELVSIRDLKIDKFFTFNNAILSSKDRIFPYKNMVNFWTEKNVNITEIEGAHYIFDRYKEWSDLL
jgi:biotin synthesis protein BioG